MVHHDNKNLLVYHKSQFHLQIFLKIFFLIFHKIFIFIIEKHACSHQFFLRAIINIFIQVIFQNIIIYLDRIFKEEQNDINFYYNIRQFSSKEKWGLKKYIPGFLTALVLDPDLFLRWISKLTDSDRFSILLIKLLSSLLVFFNWIRL